MPTLAIVILNYNGAEAGLLEPCLASLYAAPTRCQLDVWVVDNASTDNSVALIHERFPQARVIVNERNGGYAYGNNVALRRILDPLPGDPATTEYTMLLNNDTVMPAGTIDGLVDYLESHPDVGVVGPRIVLPNGALDLACRRSFPTPLNSLYRIVGLAKLFPRSRVFARYNMTYLDPSQETEIDSGVGACMLLRTPIMREAGLLDEQFFMYGEDLDWAFRIKQYGWRIMYYPGVVLHHRKRASSKRRPVQFVRAFYDAMRLFHRKHYAQTLPAPANALIESGIRLAEVIALGRNLLAPARRAQ